MRTKMCRRHRRHHHPHPSPRQEGEEVEEEEDGAVEGGEGEVVVAEEVAPLVPPEIPTTATAVTLTRSQTPTRTPAAGEDGFGGRHGRRPGRTQRENSDG